MNFDNYMQLRLKSKSENEGFARVAVAAFVSQLDPTLSEVADLKTAVSEAVTNSIIHGYENGEGEVTLFCGYTGRDFYIEVEDYGKGIENIDEAMTPLYTSKPELERSGMGFTVMEAFMDELVVHSEPGKGTKVVMKKKLASLHA